MLGWALRETPARFIVATEHGAFNKTVLRAFSETEDCYTSRITLRIGIAMVFLSSRYSLYIPGFICVYVDVYTTADGFVNVPALVPMVRQLSPDSLLAHWFGNCFTAKLSAEQTFVSYGRRVLERILGLTEAPDGLRYDDL